MDTSVLVQMVVPLAIIGAAQLVVSIVLIVILRKLLLGDTMNAIGRLKSAEEDLGRKEADLQQKLEEHETEFARKQAESEENLQRQREASERDLARLKERMVGDARSQADKIISEAQLSKDKIREQLVREMNEKAVEFAGELFKMVISQTVTEALNAAFVNELIDALEEVDETSIHVEAADAEFGSSHPLIPEQRKKLEELLARKFDVNVSIQEKVRPELLAGLTIKLGSLEIDASLLNRYREGVGEMKKAV